MMKWLKKFSNLPIFPALLSALVAPGVGQIVNRDFKRGFLLLFISVGGVIYFFSILTERLTQFLQGTPEMWKDPIVFNEALIKVWNQNPQMFTTFNLLLIITWAFGVVDAYISARRHTPTQTPTPSHEDPHSHN